MEQLSKTGAFAIKRILVAPTSLLDTPGSKSLQQLDSWEKPESGCASKNFGSRSGTEKDALLLCFHM